MNFTKPNHIFIVLFIAIFGNFSAAQDSVGNDIELPPDAIICSRSDPNVEECIKNSVNALLPTLKDGYEPIDLPPIDPYVVKSFDFKFAQGDLNFSIAVEDISMTGFASMKVKATRLRFKNNYHDMKLELSCTMPVITMQANYEGGGKFLAIDFVSKGYYNVSMTEVKVIWKFFGEMDGDFMIIKSLDANPKVKNMKIFATGLVPDPDINQLAVDYVNTYWEDVYQQFFIQTRSSWEPFLIEIVNKFFTKIPFEQLLVL